LKLNKYVLVVLVIVVIFALYTVFFAGSKRKMASVAASLEPPKMSAQPADVRSREDRVQQTQEAMNWERDPFALPSFVLAKQKSEKEAEKQRVPLKLFAIMEGARGRVAIIDNEVVAKGDIVAGERVLEIGKETVTLIQEGSKRVIMMQEPK
jgi:hypothetical protein